MIPVIMLNCIHWNEFDMECITKREIIIHLYAYTLQALPDSSKASKGIVISPSPSVFSGIGSFRLKDSFGVRFGTVDVDMMWLVLTYLMSILKFPL